MKKLLSLSLMFSLGLATVTPTLNAAQSKQAVAQSQTNSAHASGWQAAKKWWRSGRNMKALNRQEQRAFNALKKKFTLGAIIAAIVAIIGGGAAYLHHRPVRAPEAKEDSLEWKLIMAVRRQGKDEAERLIAEGADVNATMSGMTALMLAAMRGYENIVKMLLRVSSINVNAVSKFREDTALMLAARMGHKNIVKLLLDKKADKDMQNMFGQTAENLAQVNNDDELANYIRNYGKGK